MKMIKVIHSTKKTRSTLVMTKDIFKEYKTYCKNHGYKYTIKVEHWN